MERALGRGDEVAPAYELHRGAGQSWLELVVRAAGRLQWQL